MIGRATRVSTRLVLALAVLLAWRPVTPALADLYDLEGRYQCLETPGAVCGDTTPSPKPPEPAPAQKDTAQPATPAAKPGKAKEPPPKPVDPMDLLAARIQAGKPAPGDLATLRARAKTADPRAIEMLAWCAFAGIGGPRDPVQAYTLYGQAADAGSPTGRKNQAAIFKGSMTQEQRQRVLDIENSRAKPGGVN
jgi:hypothetical protein